MPKVSFASALPVGTESMQETVDIEVSGAVDRETLKQRINRELPTGIDVKSVELLPRLGKKKHLKESQFLITLSGVRLKEEAVEKFLNSEYFPVVKVNKKGEKKINARPLVKSMDLVSPNGIKLAITHTASSGSRPAEIVKSVFSLEDVHLGDMRVVKIGQTLA
jgi:radical SAM-linked protein